MSELDMSRQNFEVSLRDFPADHHLVSRYYLMASPGTSTRTPVRRTTPTSSPSLARSSPSSTPSLARANSARANAPQRPSALSTSVSSARKAAPPLKSPVKETNGIHPDEIMPTDGNDNLLLSLKREHEEKEELLVKLQNKEREMATLQEENDNLSSALTGAESRLGEIYADQERMESEMEARLEIIEKLRSQMREAEKEKRDIQRRYNEQTATFDAERQSFYDNEQHLKSRIQTLTQARKTVAVPTSPTAAPGGETDVEDEDEPAPAPQVESPTQEDNDEPPEMIALRLELNTLSVSHASVQNTLQLLQTQLFDLKRVNNELQEENESYNILLRERTLTGQFDPMRYAGTPSAAPSSVADEDDDEQSLRSGAQRSLLDRVPEVDETGLDTAGSPKRLDEEMLSVSRSGRPRPGSRRATSSPPPRGENLGDLPITGPGLDLASELGRAENKDIVEGRATVEEKFGKKGKHGRDDETNGDLAALRTEVKALKDANKALSLYASKILDRIISEEGFEHVLAVDYTDGSKPQSPRKIAGSSAPPPPPATPAKKARPSTMLFSLSRGDPAPVDLDKIPPSAAIPPAAPSAGPPAAGADAKRSRRSMSFDWKSFSLFGGGDKAPAPEPPSGGAGLRPLTLRPGATSTVMGSARKLDTHEDDDDRRERERLHATMKLMGIDAPVSPSTPVAAMRPSTSLQSTATTSTSSDGARSPPATATPSRFSFFRSRSNTSDPASQPQQALTTEALERVEAEQSIAALDAREKALSAELAKGKGSGFTEASPRTSLGDEWRSRRSRQSGKDSGSGSTVFSAGRTDAESLRRLSDEVKNDLS